MAKKLGILALAWAVALLLADPASATHPRPGGGSPFRIPLVPAYEECTNPNAAHIAPLAFPSCSPPETEGFTTSLGTTGAGGGSVKLTVYCTDGQIPPCNPTDGIDTEDVAVRVTVGDVRCLAVFPGCSAAGNDYAGDFMVSMVLRMTDHANGDPSGSTTPCTNGAGMSPCVTATVLDLTYALPGQCVDNGGPNGANCNINTSFDAAVPSTVKEFQRQVLQLSGPPGLGVHVSDAGPDGSLGAGPCPSYCGTGEEQPIANQGIFAP
jgi:hypothetical protein